MNRRSLVVTLVVCLSVALLVYFIYSAYPKNKYQWYQNFRADSDQPYGTLFIQKMLQSYKSGDFILNKKDPVHKLLSDEKYKDGNTSYVLIGQAIHLDDSDVDVMLEFVADGNDVFISTTSAPNELMDKVYSSDCITEFAYTYSRDSLNKTNFYHPSLKTANGFDYVFRMGTRDIPFYWQSLDPASLCNADVTLQPLGSQNNDRVNFMRVPYHKGNIYLHTVPIAFTNYFMIKPDKVEYASSVFSHLSGNNIIWDEVSKIPISNKDDPYSSPLYYIMQQPALKYAWWMLLVGALLYVIFAAKRTQRVIPVLEEKKNTSLEFLNVISALHYQNPNHFDMARKKMKYFQYFVRAKYGVNAQAMTEVQLARLSERSKIPAADIQLIFDRYKIIESYADTDEDPARLIELYQSIERFYKNCK